MTNAERWAKGIEQWVVAKQGVKFKTINVTTIKDLGAIQASNVTDEDFPGWGQDNFSVLDIVVDADFDMTSVVLNGLPKQAMPDLHQTVAVDMLMIRYGKGNASNSIYKISGKKAPIIKMIPLSVKAVISLKGFNSDADRQDYHARLSDFIVKALADGKVPQAVKTLAVENEYDGLKQAVEAGQAEEASLKDEKERKEKEDKLARDKVEKENWKKEVENRHKETAKVKEEIKKNKPDASEKGNQANSFAVKGVNDAKAGNYTEAAGYLDKAESLIEQMMSNKESLKNNPDEILAVKFNAYRLISIGREILFNATGDDGTPKTDKEGGVDSKTPAEAINLGKKAREKSTEGLKLSQKVKDKPTVEGSKKALALFDEALKLIADFKKHPAFSVLDRKDPLKVQNIIEKVLEDIDKGRKILEESGMDLGVKGKGKDSANHALELGRKTVDMAQEAMNKAKKVKKEKGVNFDLPNKALNEAEKSLQLYQEHAGFVKLRETSPGKAYEIIERTKKYIEEGRKITGAITSEQDKQNKQDVKDFANKIDNLQDAVEFGLRDSKQQAAPYMVGLYMAEGIPHRFLKITGHNELKIAKDSVEDAIKKGKSGYDLRYLCLIEHDKNGKFKKLNWVPKLLRTNK